MSRRRAPARRRPARACLRRVLLGRQAGWMLGRQASVSQSSRVGKFLGLCGLGMVLAAVRYSLTPASLSNWTISKWPLPCAIIKAVRPLLDFIVASEPATSKTRTMAV